MRYLTIKNIRPGMVIARPLLDEKGNILLNKGNKLTSTVFSRIQTLEVQGLYIEDEISEGIVVEDLIAPDLKINAVKALMANDISRAIQFAKEVVKDLKRLDSLKVNLIDIKNNQNYTYKHCVSTCIYSVIIGLAFRMTEEQLENLAVAAILHDIGKFGVEEKVLHKKGKLTQEEMELMKAHPRIAYDKLSSIQEISSVSRNAILYHHENVDGSGYYKLPKDKQTAYTKILHVVDVYDALCSERKYREAYSPSEAIEYIMGNIDKMFDRTVVKALVYNFPLYPIGLTLRLSNGEEAIVYSNEINSMRPVIRTMDGRLVDLSTDSEYRSITIYGIV